MLFKGGLMPPKVKITRDEIVSSAVNIVRIAGEGALNARSLATSLGCSTQPIFSNFESMEELFDAVRVSAYSIYSRFIDEELKGGDHPPYKAYGVAYIRFARAERELFKLLFMCDRNGKEAMPTADYNEAVEMIMSANQIDKETATLIHLEVWSATHGIATMIVTSFLELDESLIFRILSDIYHGVRGQHIPEVADDCN